MNGLRRSILMYVEGDYEVASFGASAAKMTSGTGRESCRYEISMEAAIKVPVTPETNAISTPNMQRNGIKMRAKVFPVMSTPDSMRAGPNMAGIMKGKVKMLETIMDPK